jgi:hypothetical protein
VAPVERIENTRLKAELSGREIRETGPETGDARASGAQFLGLLQKQGQFAWRKMGVTAFMKWTYDDVAGFGRGKTKPNKANSMHVLSLPKVLRYASRLARHEMRDWLEGDLKKQSQFDVRSQKTEASRQNLGDTRSGVGRRAVLSLIVQNKANLQEVEVGVRPLCAKDYEDESAFSGSKNKAKQTQFPWYWNQRRLFCRRKKAH